MEIRSNMKIGSLKGTVPTPSSTPAPKPAGDEASFPGAAALESALGKVPDVRSEAVARAQQLIADPGYPSAGMVKQLSTFLASRLTAPQD